MSRFGAVRSGLKFALAMIGMAVLLSRTVSSQMIDALDTYPPRFFLDHSDCEARVISSENLAKGGEDEGGCEQLTFVASGGTEAILFYPIEPVRPLDDFRANLSIMSAKEGVRVGVRVRFPFLIDPETRRPVFVTIYGADYRTPGEFASLGVGMIEKPLNVKRMALRREYGSTVDLNDAYIDGVVINAYVGPGTTSIRIDNLRIDGLIPVSDGVITGNTSSPNASSVSKRKSSSTSSSPFPLGRVTRILEHNGEPLQWIRTLGFDGVLLSSPPDAAILSEAIRTRMRIYAPPPSSPDPNLEALLEPVAGWYLGYDGVLDEQGLDRTAQRSEFCRAFPSRWQRPIVGAPRESWRRYAPMFDAMVHDLPPRMRSVTPSEELAELSTRRDWVGDRVQVTVAVDSLPPQSALRQTTAIANSIGAPIPTVQRWHSMWVQAIRSLQVSPVAIVFRSHRSLASGSASDQTRALSLSYINRMIAMIEPWVASATPSPAPRVGGATYHCGKVTAKGTDVLLLTSAAIRGSEVLAGDGETIRIELSPSDATKTAWRMTHFSAERLFPSMTPTGPVIEIVSPDAVELLVLSSDPSVGTRLVASANSFAQQASLDRWQLATELTQQTRFAWDNATAIRAIDTPRPTNLISVAEETLRLAQPMHRAGNAATSLRMARRADAWALRSQWQLAEALMPAWPMPTSSPPVAIGAAEVQAVWRPLMEDDGWSDNLLTSGSLDDSAMVGEGRWSFGKRLEGRTMSEVKHVQRGAFAGLGALRATVAPVSETPLIGGYEATAVQIRSPSIRVKAGTPLRIEAMVRTIGFGGPHQGVLVYETIGGQPMGLLIRDISQWTPVTLYRQALVDGEVQVMFELIGAGEVLIDEVSIARWQPQSEEGIPLRPMDP